MNNSLHEALLDIKHNTTHYDYDKRSKAGIAWKHQNPGTTNWDDNTYPQNLGEKIDHLIVTYQCPNCKGPKEPRKDHCEKCNVSWSAVWD